jgi:hypothetical protein
MLLRVLLNLLILLVAFSTAQQQNDQCSICGEGVSIESPYITTQVQYVDENTTLEVLIYAYTCSKVEQDASSGSSNTGSSNSTTCYIFQEAAQATLNCNCTQFVLPPTALGNPPAAPSPQDPSTAPSTAPPALSAADVVILCMLIGGLAGGLAYCFAYYCQENACPFVFEG